VVGIGVFIASPIAVAIVDHGLVARARALAQDLAAGAIELHVDDGQ